jgi:hypothetical protein
MNGRGVQNAQMQGSQNVSEAPTSWWSIFAEGGDGLDGLSRFLRGDLGRMRSAFVWYFLFLVRPGEG